jgi:allophanate hydrolase subunit 2
VSVTIVELAGFALVQDLGRAGHMHEGLAPGGALVPELLVAANVAAGNAPGAPAIELYGGMAIRADGDVVVATEDGVRVALGVGASLRVPARRDLRVRYVAFGGGIDAPCVLGGRGAALHAGIGRALGRGERIATASPTATATATTTATATAHRSSAPPLIVGAADGPSLRSGVRPTTPTAIRVIPGPDLERFPPDALAALLGRSWIVSANSDRVGTRLEGGVVARLDADDTLSAPLVRGAIEVPASGAPIVLGPDHPTTGGYPVLAVVARADQGHFFMRPLGAQVRFCHE